MMDSIRSTSRIRAKLLHASKRMDAGLPVLCLVRDCDNEHNTCVGVPHDDPLLTIYFSSFWPDHLSTL